MTRQMLRAARVLILLATALMLLAGCAINPVTGRPQLALITEGQEIAMGREGAQSVEQQIGLVDDDELQAYLQELGMRMARNSERPDIPWQFGVVDDPTPNAFALPGGPIYFTRGILGLMRNEAELAAVLGHEIGHITARHSVAMISRAQLAQVGIGIGAVLSPTFAQLGELAGGGLSLLFLHYGRDAERQADDLGFGYALEQGYDMREMPNVFAALGRFGEARGGSPLPAWLSSHPLPEERIARIEERLAGLDRPLEGTRVGVETYMSRIDGMVFGENPRNGFFEGRRFMHPELGFRIDFPSDWRTQNLRQAVMAQSPGQDGMMQLTIARGGRDEAASRFFNSEGVTASDVRSRTINGHSARTGAFEAQTPQGRLRGVAAFVDFEERTYQILGFAPAQRFEQHERSLRASIDSFDRLTDPAALEVRPNRIETRQTSEPMTLAEFNERFPSEISMEELALINHLEGPEARIPAGYYMKRVVTR